MSVKRGLGEGVAKQQTGRASVGQGVVARSLGATGLLRDHPGVTPLRMIARTPCLVFRGTLLPSYGIPNPTMTAVIPLLGPHPPLSLLLLPDSNRTTGLRILLTHTSQASSF